MVPVNDRSSSGGILLPQEELTAQRNSLALDALSKLANQFADQPEFNRLVEVLVLTLSGQFSAPNSFASVQRPGSRSQGSLFVGTGRFRNSRLLSSLDLSHEHRDYFVQNYEPQFVEQFDMSDQAAKLGFVLAECEVTLVVPLLHGNRLIGVIGLGEKATRKSYTQEDLDLLAALVNSVAPFIANSFLFEEITELNRWHLEILDSVRQGVFVFDQDGQLAKINQAGYDILKVFRTKLPGIESLTHVPVDWIFPGNIYPGWSDRLIEEGFGPAGDRTKNMVAGSEDNKRIFSVRVSGLKTEHSHDRGFVVTLDDVTAQKENEQRMFDLEKFADKGVMASSIAHELNNFLALLLGGVELAKINLSGQAVEKTDETLGKLENNVLKMKRFTEGLMDYGKLDTAKDQGNLNAVISDVLSFISVQKKFRGITITADLSPGLPDFEMDVDQIAQLLLNTMNNAADAIQEAAQPTGKITIATSATDDDVSLSVADNGCGIKPEVRDRLFNAHLTTKPDGHGYGLVTCSKIIGNHQGQVEIVSDVGQGALFIFRFPIKGTPNEA